MGSSVSYQSQPDNLGLLYINKTRTFTKIHLTKQTQTNLDTPSASNENNVVATKRSDGVRTVATQTEASGFGTRGFAENSDVSIQKNLLPAEHNVISSQEDFEELDNISVSSQDSVSSMFTEPTAYGLERIEYHMKRLKKRKDLVNPHAFLELAIFAKALPKPKPNEITEKFDKRIERFIKEMVKFGLVDVLNRILREHSESSLTAMTPKDLTYVTVNFALGFMMNATLKSGAFRDSFKEHKLYTELFKLIDNTRLRPGNNGNYRNITGHFKLKLDYVMQILSTLVFCITKSDLRNEYRICEAVRIFDEYRKSHAIFRPLAEIGFAFVVMDTDKDLMLLSKEHLDFYKRLFEQMPKLNKATGGKQRGLAEIHKTENMLKALNYLLVNDSNKIAIAKHGVLDFYVTSLDEKVCSENELIEATKGLLLMAGNAREILKASGCIEKLEYLSEHSEYILVKDQARDTVLLIQADSLDENYS